MSRVFRWIDLIHLALHFNQSLVVNGMKAFVFELYFASVN